MFLFVQVRICISLAVSLLLCAGAQGLNTDNRGTNLRKTKKEGVQWNMDTDSKTVNKHHRLEKTFEAQANSTTHRFLDESDGPGDARIIGGTTAAAGEFPFFVQGQGCGASLIWYDIALTAAHCAGRFNSAVYIGNYRRNTPDSGVLTRNVVRQVPHPNYNDATTNNDFMILKLSSEVPRSGRIQPIQINTVASTPAANAPLTAIGFGSTTVLQGPASPNLLKVSVNYVAPTTCTSYWGSTVNAATMLCAAASGKGVCSGDSGGPIINSAGVQVGISSFVADCAKNNGVPDVYARTSGASTWIRSQVCALASSRPSFCTTNSTGTTTSSVVITVQLDEYPEETAWVLRNSAGQALASQAAYSVYQDYALIQRTLSLPAGTYTFTMTDEYEDGICCDGGNGYFNIKVNGVTVVSSNGAFGASFQQQFTIGTRSFIASEGGDEDTSFDFVEPPRKEKLTGNSTVAKPCVDSEEGMFEVNQNVGEQTCAWLRANMDDFRYLCDFVKVARVCPETCSLCGSD